MEDHYAAATIAKGEGTIGRVWLTGIPAVRDGSPDPHSLPERSSAAVGLDRVLAVPIMVDAKLKSIVVWYF